jgi:hypothetical protein
MVKLTNAVEWSSSLSFDTAAGKLGPGLALAPASESRPAGLCALFEDYPNCCLAIELEAAIQYEMNMKVPSN